MMERPATPRTPAESRYAFDWDDVAPRREPAKAPDFSDLTLDDRRALGLAATPRSQHHAAEPGGDAAAALRDVLVKGGALGKRR